MKKSEQDVTKLLRRIECRLMRDMDHSAPSVMRPIDDAEASKGEIQHLHDYKREAAAEAKKYAEEAGRLAALLHDAQRDAERYRRIRRGQHWSVINGIGDELRADVLDAAIDAAMAKAKEAQG